MWNNLTGQTEGERTKKKVKVGLGELKWKVNGIWKVDKYSRWKD
jgi:hypothetical protein